MDKQVIIYTTQDCIECTLVKQMLTQLQVEYEARDVSNNPHYQKEVEHFGFLGLPVTVVGKKAVKGYRPEEIQKLLVHK